MNKIMESGKSTIGNLLLAGLLLAGLVYVFLCSNPALSFFNPFFSISTNNLQTTEKAAPEPDDLDVALTAAATENKTVIIAVVNRAYAEQDATSETTMLDLFLESFWLGEGTRRLVDNLLVVAVDEAAYQRCRFKRLHCYRMVTDGVDYGGEKVYMSTEFIKMMWSRTLFLLDVLKRGYNFIFTDTDVMWLRNPFPILNQNESMDLQISVDKFNGINGSSGNNHLINTGFYFIRSNNKTISLFDKWYSMKDNSTGKKEQDVLLDLMGDGIVTTLGLGVQFLDTRHFSGFCEDSKDVRAVTTVHANCCRHINAKVTDLTAVLRNWKQFYYNLGNQTLAANATTTFQWSPHVGCANSWRGR